MRRRGSGVKDEQGRTTNTPGHSTAAFAQRCLDVCPRQEMMCSPHTTHSVLREPTHSASIPSAWRKARMDTRCSRCRGERGADSHRKALLWYGSMQTMSGLFGDNGP